MTVFDLIDDDVCANCSQFILKWFWFNFFWENVLLNIIRGELQKDAEYSNVDNFMSALGSMP